MTNGFVVQIATIWWTGFSHFPGNLKRAHVQDIPITKSFFPTEPRRYVWLVEFWHLPVKWVFVALPIGMLVTLLFYYDHNVSSLTAQARAFPLKKPAGFHWDFFLLGWTTFVSGFIGIPFPNGLVPQAPVHTDALTTYHDERKVIHTDDGEVIHQKVTVAERVTEQRMSHFLMCLLLVGTMTRPLLVVLGTMPRAVFSGVFFVVGWGSVEGNGIIKKLLFLCKEHRYIDPHDPLLRVPRRQILHFVFWQLLGWAMCVSISQTIAAIGFPVLITAMIPFRVAVMPKLFTAEELEIMDSLTADNVIVLASLGGKPVMPEQVTPQTPRSEETPDLEAREREEEQREVEKKEQSATPNDDTV